MALKVTYIDDETELCEIFKDAFSSTGVVIDVYSDPQKALDGVKANPPDLLFIDYRLPNTTGIQLAEKMNIKVPMHLITGELDLEMPKGFSSILAKPLDFEKIQNIIDSFHK